MTKELTIKTLNRALGHLKETKNLFPHSDRGVQYCSNEYLSASGGVFDPIET
ncbi:MAG: hypothetical protein NTX05_01320 [Fusobacteria bacterium]|nr:hypothetical protein [Fusobacteriota bacterium]